METQPACRVLPKSSKQAAVAYLVTATFQCKFAVKGGGHAAFGGGSSVQGGITIDLQNLKSITVNADKTVIQVGAGNRWINVYEYLTPKNLSVIGGRVSDIGVSGLTLGGRMLQPIRSFSYRLQVVYPTSLDAMAGLVIMSRITKYVASLLTLRCKP